MENRFKIAIILIIVLISGFVWYFAFRKYDGSCSTDKECGRGWKCIRNHCSSGKAGSRCDEKTDCSTGFCVGEKDFGFCTSGKNGEACETNVDCENGLICKRSVCPSSPGPVECGSCYYK